MTRALDRNALLVLPMLGLLVLVFLGPLFWFFAITFSELLQRGVFEALSYAGAALTSRAVLQAFATTLKISVSVTLACLIIAYPLAWYLTRAGKLAFNAVLGCIIIPYFTSVIVRTYAWMVLLGSNGIVNDALQGTGLQSRPVQLLYNETGVLIGMTYVLLPYVVLTLYSAMKSIDPRLMPAARGMGASDFFAFRTVYFPLSLPGVVSGGLIVFILALGYFITPALMGGPQQVMIAMLIQNQVEVMLNWPLAAVLSLALLGTTLVLFAIYVRFGGMKALAGDGF